VKRIVIACLLGLSLTCQRTAAQTLEEVREAIDASAANDAEAMAAALKRLRAWGDDALPHLRTIACERSLLGRLGPAFDFARGGKVVRATRTIDTPAAIDLLIDIMDGETAVDPHQALLEFRIMSSHAERLRTDHRFKTIIFRFTLSRGRLASLERSTAAEVIGDMGWEEGEDVLAAMARDPDLDVAERAAGALYQLTGRIVKVPRPPLEFPVMGQEAPPLGPALELGRVRGRFATWRDGEPALVQAKGGALLRVEDGSEPPERWQLPWTASDVLSVVTESGEDRWIFVFDANPEVFGNEAVACLDQAGVELWRWKPGRAHEIPLTALYGERGITGVALGPGGVGAEGVVTLDLEGRQIFSAWSPVIYELDSHPLLPDRFVQCGGAITVRDNAGEVLASTRSRASDATLGHLYASHAQVFPDADGRLAVIAAGAGPQSREIVVKLDADLRLVWRASLPADVGGLAVLERDELPPLFAAATADGQLLVFDADGGLRAPVRLADEPPPGERVAIYAMDAGLLGDGERALLVSLLRESYLFPYR
jgi:hypothetical protein